VTEQPPQSPASRRKFLGLAGGAAAGLILPTGLQPSQAAQAGALRRTAGAGLSGPATVRMAMHVHGSWSEGPGSWQAQFSEAAAHGIDVLYLTDHDHRATAYGYVSDLTQVDLVHSSQGTLAKQNNVHGPSGLQLAATSASADPATVTATVPLEPTLIRPLRTAIAGHRLRQVVTGMRCDLGAHYEVTVQLSYRPATGGRPAGHYGLCYRFGQSLTGPLPSARYLESGGLIGVVSAPPIEPNTTQVLIPEDDIAILWPDLVAFDNCFYGLEFSATSQQSGAAVTVNVASMVIDRLRSEPDQVIADQERMIAAYAEQYPTVTGRVSSEASLLSPHLNAFAWPPMIADVASLSTDPAAHAQRIVADVHARKGLVSWNHPFDGADPLFSPGEQAQRRREVFRSMVSVSAYRADIVEVGYRQRGGVSTETHLDLWDTFSRNGYFLTGNGVSDDHSGQDWSQQLNSFFTGAWAENAGPTTILSSLAAGRVYLASLADWPAGEIDLLVDSRVPMGGVSISQKATRRLTIRASDLPPGGVLQLVVGPVDFCGAEDPGTTVWTSLSQSRLAGGAYSLPITTQTPIFVRAQVRTAAGQIVGVSNPIWLLRRWPVGGVPQARRGRV
jgi:hypothetical protein